MPSDIGLGVLVRRGIHNQDLVKILDNLDILDNLS